MYLYSVHATYIHVLLLLLLLLLLLSQWRHIPQSRARSVYSVYKKGSYTEGIEQGLIEDRRWYGIHKHSLDKRPSQVLSLGIPALVIWDTFKNKHEWLYKYGSFSLCDGNTVPTFDIYQEWVVIERVCLRVAYCSLYLNNWSLWLFLQLAVSIIQMHLK